MSFFCSFTSAIAFVFAAVRCILPSAGARPLFFISAVTFDVAGLPGFSSFFLSSVSFFGLASSLPSATASSRFFFSSLDSFSSFVSWSAEGVPGFSGFSLSPAFFAFLPVPPGILCPVKSGAGAPPIRSTKRTRSTTFTWSIVFKLPPSTIT